MSELTRSGSAATERPERYGSQLVKHFTHKDLPGSWEDGRGFVEFSFGKATFSSEPGTLNLRIDAADAESLDRLRDVVERHLVRFGARDEISVVWS
jgi:uncharacterized protein